MKILKFLSISTVTLILLAPVGCSHKDSTGGRETPQQNKSEDEKQDVADVFVSFKEGRQYMLLGTMEDFDETIYVRDSINLTLPMTIAGKDVSALRKYLLKESIGVSETDPKAVVANWIVIPKTYDNYPTKPVSSVPDYGMNVWVTSSDVDTLYVSQNIVPFSIVNYQYMGGAHGMAALEYVNYYVPESRIIALSDLLTEQGISQLNKKIGKIAKTKDPEIADMLWIEGLPSDNNFYISKDGKLVLSYSEYEAGPYALGCYEVSLFPEELAPYLSDFGQQFFASLRTN